MAEEIYTSASAEKLCLQFRSFVYTLIESVCVHCRLDAAHAGIAPGKSDEFGEFRQKASDLVADVVFIVEADKCFEKVTVQRGRFDKRGAVANKKMIRHKIKNKWPETLENDKYLLASHDVYPLTWYIPFYMVYSLIYGIRPNI